MAEHPIEGLMLTAMNSIKDMVDVNTIIGDPIQAANNIAVIPISKVSFGFAAGGSEFKGETVDEYNKKDKDEQIQYRLPFGGGAGAGVSVNPVAFLVIQGNVVKLLPVNHSTSLDKLLDYIPDLFEKVNNMANKCMQNKKEQTEKIINQMQKRSKQCEEGQDVIQKKVEVETKVEETIKEENE
ncbi:MAG: sporulation protein YtfJ [Clostridia bacterium]|nr:sporulation protein YtfJ [Clostridia bacterium]